jgi:uncharacterized protein (TIGR03083 family)
VSDRLPGWRLEPRAVRHAYHTAAEALVATVGHVGSDAWERPGLGQWTVRDLAGHATRALLTVEAYLDAPAAGPVSLQHPAAYFAVLAGTYADPVSVAERGRIAGRALGPDPAATVADLARRVLARTDAASDDAPVSTPAGVMRLIDYLPSRVLELVVHRLDLARATGLVDPADGPDVALATALAGGLAAEGPAAGAVLLALTGRQALPGGTSVV